MSERLGNEQALLVDMDGVIADTMGGLFDYVEEHFGHALIHEDIKDYWFSGLPVEDIFVALRSKGFYRNLDLITGAVRGVNRLREEYSGNVYICSSPMDGAEFSETEKRDFLEEHFDEQFAREAIITKPKSKVLGRVIIEDNPQIEGGIWKPVMFDQPYNRMATQFPRMYGWHDLQVVRDEMRDSEEES